MKKALMMGVSGAAMLVAVSAQAQGVVAQGQDFEVANSQGQHQAGSLYAGGGDGGSAKAYAAGGDGGGAGGSHGYGSYHKSGMGGSGGDGGMASAKAYGGDGGMAKAKGYQNQGQDQYVSGSQTQYVQLPDIDVDVAVPGSPGTGGAAGPGSGSGANTVEGNNNEIQRTQGNGPSNVASFGGIAVRDNLGDVQIGDGVNITMRNNTEMNATNNLGDIDLNGGNSNGGEATGGNLAQTATADNSNYGKAGDGSNYIKDVDGGDGGYGGNGTAVSANVNLQAAKSLNKSEGGDGKAYSSAYGKSDADAYGKASSYANSSNYGKAKNYSSADSGASRKHGYGYGHGSDSGDARANGKASNWQDAGAWADAFAKPIAKARTDVDSVAAGLGGDAGDIHSKTGNSSDQAAHSMAAGGNGGAGGDAKVYADAHGGDNTQLAASSQNLNAATGATQGGAGGNSSVTFGTGAIGAISLGTVSGIATVAQNSGLSANQFTAFSINANTNF